MGLKLKSESVASDEEVELSSMKGPLIPKNSPSATPTVPTSEQEKDAMKTPILDQNPDIAPVSSTLSMLPGKPLDIPFRDIVQSAIAGISKGQVEVGNTLIDLVAASMESGSPYPPVGSPASGPGMMSLGAMGQPGFDPSSASMLKGPLQEIQAKVDEFWNPGQTIPGKLTDAMTQWLSVAGPTAKSMAIKNGLVKWAIAGGIGDFAAFDPHMARISNLAIQYDNPVFRNALTKWLATDEDDAELEGRMKQSVEGTIIGLTFEGFLKSLRMAKGAWKAQKTVNQISSSMDKPKINIAGAEEVDKLIISGEARLGESFKAQDMDVRQLDTLIPTEARLDDERLLDTAVSIQEGHTPTVVVKTEGGVPTEILSGGDVVQLMRQLRKGNITVKTVEAPSLDKIRSDAARIETTFSSMEEASQSIPIKVGKAIREIFSKDKWVDVNAKANDALEKTGAYGQRAVMELNLARNASGRAKVRFQKASKEIYDGLTRNENRDLDRLIVAMRNVQIDSYKGEGKIKHQGGHKGKEFDNYITNLEVRLGPEKFGDLQRRARSYFNAFKKELDDLYTEGVISEVQYSKMKELDYTPREMLRQLDPEHTIEIGGRKVTIPESGIAHFDEGSVQATQMDQRLLLSQAIVRTQARIMKNNANRELIKLAVDNPENGVVSFKKKQGMSELKAMVDGDAVSFYMDSDIAGSWVSQNKEMSAFMANIFKFLSGSAWLKPLATGHNPEFVLTTFPMDVGLAYMSTSAKTGFSKHLPKYVAQLTADLAETAGDAFGRKGAFLDFAEDGGMINFLASQGRDFLASGNKGFKLLGDIPDAFAANRNIDPHWEKLKNATSYLNATFEVWMRLAIRNRGLKSGLDNKAATYEAIRYFDLSSGGGASKGLDTAVPYFNAMTQAFRSAGREGMKDPKRLAAKVGWLASGTAAWNSMAYLTQPNTMNSIEDKKKNTHIVIPTGIHFKDEYGYDRYMYFQLKKDPVNAIATMMTDAAVINYYSEGKLDGSFIEGLGDSFMTLANVMPNVQAYRNYVDNKSFWRKDIWKSRIGGVGDISPRNEYIGDPEGKTYLSKDTAEFYKQMGRITGAIKDKTGLDVELSPIRLQHALSQTLPNNTFTDIMGKGYQAMLQGMPEDFMDKHIGEILAGSPMLKRIIRLSHPLEKEIERERDESLASNDQNLILINSLNRKLENLDSGRDSKRDVELWIKQQDKVDQIKLINRMNSHVEISEKYKKFQNYNIPPKGWWSSVAARSSERATGDVFYWRWRDADPVNRRAMERMASSVKGFWTLESFNQFEKLKREFGVGD